MGALALVASACCDIGADAFRDRHFATGLSAVDAPLAGSSHVLVIDHTFDENDARTDFRHFDGFAASVSDQGSRSHFFAAFLVKNEAAGGVPPSSSGTMSAAI
jgi:hypothetical protein